MGVVKPMFGHHLAIAQIISLLYYLIYSGSDWVFVIVQVAKLDQL